jgi:GNAT superfamily N-acetyltransferase
MMFELTREMVDQIIFGMENQHEEYCFDLQSGAIVDQSEADDPDRYVPLPTWRSVDGYTLMEKYVATLQNPIYRERLREVLTAGRGVFRQFKNTIKERPELERHWYHFKEREMRKVVAEWYNQLRDSWGLEPVDEEQIIETDELVESDFSVRLEQSEERLAEVESLDEEAFEEAVSSFPPEVRAYLYRAARRGLEGPSSDRSLLLSADTPLDEFAGFIWGVVDASEAGILEVVQLYVAPEFRGLGLAGELLQKMVETAHDRGLAYMVLRLPGECRAVAGLAGRIGFDLVQESHLLDLGRWYREERA